MCNEYLRVNGDPVSPVIMARWQTTLWRRLEGTTIWVGRDIPRFLMDDRFDKCCEFLVVSEEGVIVCKLVKTCQNKLVLRIENNDSLDLRCLEAIVP